MSLPDLNAVRRSIRTHLLDELEGQISESQIAYENKVFTPPQLYDSVTQQPNLWLRETFFVITESNSALQLYEARGRTLFDIFYPVGEGTKKPEALRQMIADAFEKKYGLTNVVGLAVGIDKITRDAARSDERWYVTPISVFWRTYSVATLNKTT